MVIHPTTTFGKLTLLFRRYNVKYNEPLGIKEYDSETN
jgi:hypothetical protein